jgi:hypothetical protein
MMATKLNAQVIIKNLQNMHEKSLASGVAPDYIRAAQA